MSNASQWENDVILYRSFFSSPEEKTSKNNNKYMENIVQNWLVGLSVLTS